MTTNRNNWFGRHVRETYRTRQIVLDKLGFLDYTQYLQSPLWLSIREKVFKKYGKKCCLCDDQAQHIHHNSYSEGVMKGEDSFLHLLHPICESCHKRIEFGESGNKLPFVCVQRNFRTCLLQTPKKIKHKSKKSIPRLYKNIAADDLNNNLRTCIKCRIRQGLSKFDWVSNRKIRICKKCCRQLFDAGKMDELKFYEGIK